MYGTILDYYSTWPGRNLLKKYQEEKCTEKPRHDTLSIHGIRKSYRTIPTASVLHKLQLPVSPETVSIPCYK